MQKSGRSCTSACEEPQRLLGEFPMILEDAAVPASGKMLSSAFGSAWKSATELMVGTMMSLSPLATRTGWLIALSFFAPSLLPH